MPKAKKDKAPKAPKKPTLAVLALQPELMATAGVTRELCQKCGRLDNGAVVLPFVPKNYTGELLIVIDYWLEPDAVREARTLAKEAGFALLDIAIVPAVRCGDSEPSMNQIRCCRPYVLRAIEALKPKHILAMGSSALRSVTNDGKMVNVTKHRGRPVPVPGTKEQAYVTYSPDSLLRGGIHYRPRILEDLQRLKQARIERPTNTLPVIDTYVSVDTEYAPDKSLLTVGIANTTAAIAVEPNEPEFYETVGSLVETKDNTILVGHSVSGDVDKLVELGVAKRGWVSGRDTLDSLLLSRMKDENRGKGGYELEGLMCSGRNVEPWKQDTLLYSKEDATLWPVDLRKERCRLDAWASVHLVDDLVQDYEIQKMPIELVHRVAMSLSRVEHAGMYIDEAKFEALKASLAAEREMYRDKLTKKAQAAGMLEFIPTNDEHIRELLFKKLKLPVTKKTKTEKLPAVDKVTLKQFSDKEEVKLLLAFNSADKSYTTNIVRLGKISTPSEVPGLLRMAPHINPLGARTGRRSSGSDEEAGIESMNSQNWPVPMRQMVVSRFPGGSILEFDYKSLEIFLLAYEAQDEKLYDYFANRGGYIAVAKDLWKMEVKKGTNEYRATKSVVLGTNYNMQTPKMADNLWNNVGIRFSSDYDEHTEKTDELRRAYLDLFPGVRPYMRRQERFLAEHGYVVSKIGQVRHLPHVGKDTPGYGHMINQAINFPIQSLASAVTGSALIDVEAALCAEFNIDIVEYHGRLMRKDWPKMPIIVNEVHDNLVYDIPDMNQRAIALIKNRMEAVETLRRMLPDFKMPLKVDRKLGPHWGMEE